MSDSAKILLVDDDEKLLKLLSIRLTRAGYVVNTASSGKQALSSVSASRPDVVITDVCMDAMDGMQLFRELQSREKTLPVILLTAHGTINDAVDATRQGVFDYLTKPYEGEKLLAAVERALESTGYIKHQSDNCKDQWDAEIITTSSRMTALLAEARKIASSDSSVLLVGESGTGKELLARAIHNASPRSEHRFVAINCTAIPESLFESELFGHVRGAFTGASHDAEGLMVSANNGTLLLDEVGDMPLAFQAKLLRVLQEKEVRPVGSKDTRPIDVRVIAATHRDLEAMVTSGDFREDLYYRVNVVTLDVPSLEQRREDIPLLVNHFVEQIKKGLPQTGETALGFASDALRVLNAAAWPGNIRQLRNVVEQCLVLSTTRLIPTALVERALRQVDAALLPLAEAKEKFEMEYLQRLLQLTDGNVSEAARVAGRNRTDFYKLLKRHDIDPEPFRNS